MVGPLLTQLPGMSHTIWDPTTVHLTQVIFYDLDCKLDHVTSLLSGTTVDSTQVEARRVLPHKSLSSLASGKPAAMCEQAQTSL